MAELVGHGYEPQAVGLSAVVLAGGYSQSPAATYGAMAGEINQASRFQQCAIHDEAGSLVGLVRSDLQPDVRYLQREHLGPRFALAIPFSYIGLPHIKAYIAALTDRRLDCDPGAEYLASSIAQALGNVAAYYRGGYAATIVPGAPPQPAGPIHATDRMHRALRERVRQLQEVKVGHFAVRAVDGRIDKQMLRQESTLYATTVEPGQGGLDELQYGPVDFRDVLAQYP